MLLLLLLVVLKRNKREEGKKMRRFEENDFARLSFSIFKYSFTCKNCWHHNLFL